MDKQIYKEQCVKYGHRMVPMEVGSFDGILCYHCCYVYDGKEVIAMAKKEKKKDKKKKKSKK